MPHRLHLLLLIPALAVLLLWQFPAPLRLPIAATTDAQGFDALEQGEFGAFRWSAAQSQVSLPAHSFPAVLELRAAIAPGAQISLQANTAAPVLLAAPANAPQLRRYQLLLPAAPDSLGWATVQLNATPPAQVDGRTLGLALYDIAFLPVARGVTLPPWLAWLFLAALPALLALVLRLAGLPRPLTLITAIGIGLGGAWLWWAQPEALHPLLLDLQAFFQPAIWQWWAVAQLIGLAVLPLTRRLFAGLPLAGYPLSKALGLLLLAWVVWLWSLLGLLPFGLPSILLGLLLLGAISWLPLLVRHRDLLRQPQLLLNRLTASLPAIGAYELLFIGALFIGIWLRWHGAVGPALTATEKPMEIAMLNALLRYRDFPPLDPWFAGYGLNYYYLGYVPVAALALLTNTPTASAFNLGFALTVALTITGVAYLATALVANTRIANAPRPGRSAQVGVALLALIATLALGSQANALQLIIGSPLFRALDAPQLLQAIAQRSGGASELQLSYATPPSWDGPPFSSIAVAEQPTFDWFLPSRTLYDDIPLADGTIERRYAISEFPAFSFYLGDLHPHVLAMPYTLLALAAAFGLLRTPLEASARYLRLALLGLILGSLYAINSWDAPTYALLCFGALLLALRQPGSSLIQLLRDTAVLAGATVLAALPFLLTFRPPAGPTQSDLPILGRLASTFAIAQNHTQLHSFLLIFGLFLLILIAFCYLYPPTSPSAVPGSFLGKKTWPTALRWAFPLIVIAAQLGDFALLLLIPLLGLLALYAWQYAEQPPLGYILLIASVGSIALLIPELIYIRDHLEGEMSRMITIFKFYYQGWLLWGIAAAYLAWVLLRHSLQHLKTIFWLPIATVLLLGALIYPVGLVFWATPWRAAERTLDGMAFLAEDNPSELAAVQWLSSSLAPNEILLTGFCNCDYEQLSRVSALSGVQTLLGWMDGHERVWRSGYPEQLSEIAARERDIAAIYTTEDPTTAAALIEQYSIDYIYLGPNEQRLYGPAATQHLAATYPLAFSDGPISIYRTSQ